VHAILPFANPHVSLSDVADVRPEVVGSRIFLLHFFPRYQGPVGKSTSSLGKGDRLWFWLRGGFVRHRVDGPEKVPNSRIVSVVEGSERGSSQMGIVIKQPARTSVSAKKQTKGNSFAPPSANHADTIQRY